MAEVKDPSARRAGRAGRLTVAVAVALAVTGALLSGFLLVAGAAGGESRGQVGSPVETDYGSFTVTRAAKAFVPRTQGPPTMAKMTGAVGTDRLQVWVRLVNGGKDEAVRVSPDQLRLEVAGLAEQLAPEGSTLEDDLLPPASSLDGQVWFDTEAASPRAPRSLVYTAPDGGTVTVPLPHQGRHRDGEPHHDH